MPPEQKKPEGALALEGSGFSMRHLADLAETTDSPEKNETLPRFGSVEFGYCRPFPDPDQIVSYCLQRYMGNISADAEISVQFGRSTPEVQDDPKTLKLETSYDKSHADPTYGNYAHRTIQTESGEQEVSIAYATYLDNKERIATEKPEQEALLRSWAEYADALDLKTRPMPKGVKPPFVTDLFRGAFLQHFAHPEVKNGVSQTDVSAGIEACYEIFETLMADKWTPDKSIDLEAHPELSQLVELNRTVKEHDRVEMKKFLPEVVGLANGINVGFLDLREADTILPMGGYAQGYNYQDTRSERHASVVIMAFSERDPDGKKTDVSKIQIAANVSNPIVAQLGIDLPRLKDEWNNREAQSGVGVENIEPGINWIDGHTHPSNADIMTLISSPTETGAGLDPLEIQNMIEAYFDVDRLTEEEMQFAAEKLRYAHAELRIIPALYPNQNLRERAFVASNRFRNEQIPDWYTPTRDDLVLIRESDLAISREAREKPAKKRRGQDIEVLPKPQIIAIELLTQNQKQQASRERFEQFMVESPRAALTEIAKGYINFSEYEPSKLLSWYEGLSENPHSIAQIYDPQNEILLPPDESLQPWATHQETETTKHSRLINKYVSPDSAVFMIDTQLSQLLYEQSQHDRPDVSERYLTILETIVSSPEYQQSHNEEFYDHVPYDLLHIALNLERAHQSLQYPLALRQHSQVEFNALTQNRAAELIRDHATPHMREQLQRYIEQTTQPSSEMRKRALEIVGSTEVLEIKNPLTVTEAPRDHPTQETLAILVGRQLDRTGAPLTITIERDLGHIDTYAFSSQGELAPQDFMDAAAQIVEQIDTAVERLAGRIGVEGYGEVRIVLGGPMDLYGVGAARIMQLQEKHSNLEINLYKWMGNKYEKAIRFEDVMDKVAQRNRAK